MQRTSQTPLTFLLTLGLTILCRFDSERQPLTVPFIGDGYDEGREVFVEARDKKLSVVSLEVKDGSLHGTVVLRSLKHSNIPNCTHIVVGVSATVPEYGILRGTSTVTWALQYPQLNVSHKDIDEIVHPGYVTLVKYLLLPLVHLDTTVFKVESLTVKSHELVEKISEPVLEVVKVMGKLNIPHDLLWKEDIANITRAKEFISVFSDDVRSICIDQIKDLASANWVYKTVVLLKQNARVGIRVANAIQSLNNLRKKYNNFVKLMFNFEGKGVKIILKDEEFNRILGSTVGRLCCLLIFGDSVDQKVCNTFLEIKLKYGAEATYCVVDLKRINKQLIPGYITKPVIRTFQNGEVVIKDVIWDLNLEKMNLAISFSLKVHYMLKKRAILNVSCPGFYAGSCSKSKRMWICKICRATLYYGFNGRLHCTCGSGAVDEFEFTCADEGHNVPTSICPKWKEQLMKLVPLKEVDLLLLGESASQAYHDFHFGFELTKKIFQKLEINSDDEPIILLPYPIKFTIKDKEMAPCPWLDNDFDKSNFGIFSSFSVQFQNNIVNFLHVDTPNCSIDSKIANLTSKLIRDYNQLIGPIHGVCILLKENIRGEYCAMLPRDKELLYILSENCINNIVFCYDGSIHDGPTFEKKYFEASDIEIDFPNVKVSDRVYTFNSKIFQYLCLNSKTLYAHYKGRNKESKDYWDKSVAEAKRFLNAIVKFNPHTISLEAKKHFLWSMYGIKE